MQMLCLEIIQFRVQRSSESFECPESMFPPSLQHDLRRQSKPFSSVGVTRSVQELRQLQEADPLLSLVMNDFPRRQVPTQQAKNRRWLALKKIWPQLQMEDGVLYRVGARQEYHQSQKPVGVTKCFGC